MCLDLLLCCSCTCEPVKLPSSYVLLDVLGEGGYGVVMRCRNRNTKEIVAVKISKRSNNQEEINMMEKLMRHNLHRRNIVRFLGSFSTPQGPALVMEKLDISVEEYLSKMWNELIPLSDIRGIIQQMAVALDGLKSIGVIHADIKPNNIMIVDQWAQPLRVKLIDFGMAIHTSQAKQGMQLQQRYFRAPEVILGLPFTEAIDMWSLGCVMAVMLTKGLLCYGRTPDEIMQCIVFHLGQPEDHLLDRGLHTEKYFTRTDKNGWEIKGHLSKYNPSNRYALRFRDERLDNKDEDEVAAACRCLDLLKAMLRLDPAERITPIEVLLHPFIDDDSAPASAAPRSTKRGKEITGSKNPPTPSARPENTLRLDDLESSDSSPFYIRRTSRPMSWTSSSDYEDPAPTPRERKTTNIQPAHRSPSPSIPPSCVIYVQPAGPENTLLSEDQESSDSFQTGLKKSSESPVRIAKNDKSSETDWTMEQQWKKKKRKKKNCFRRFFSWMKKTSCCCVTCVHDNKERIVLM